MEFRPVFPRPEAAFDRLAARLPPLPGWTGGAVAVAGLAAGTAAVAFHHPWIGGGVLLAGFMADGLGQAMGRRGHGGTVAILPLGLLLVPFGFALADPAGALAAMFLMFSLCVFTTLSGRRMRLLHWLSALGLLAACLLPDHFSLLAYIIGIACFVMAGQGMAERA